MLFSVELIITSGPGIFVSYCSPLNIALNCHTKLSSELCILHLDLEPNDW